MPKKPAKPAPKPTPKGKPGKFVPFGKKGAC